MIFGGEIGTRKRPDADWPISLDVKKCVRSKLIRIND